MPGGLGRIDLSQPISMEQGISALTNTETSAMMALQQMGIHPPEKPNDSGGMPEDIVSLDDNQLGYLLNQIGQYCGFVEFKLSEAKIAKNAAEERLNFVKSRIRLTLRSNPDIGTKLTVADKDDLVRTNAQVVDAQRDFNYKDAVYELTLRVRDSAQRNWETISRRITQKGQEIERMRRIANVDNIPLAPMSRRTFTR
jgi:hypothetical protein